MIHNTEIVEIFNRLADLLEIEGENPFRIRAYRNAARVISSLPRNVADLAKEGFDLTDLPGIGHDLAQKIQTIAETGKLPLLEKVEKRVPPILSELTKIEGLGPKRIQALYSELKVQSIADLKHVISSGKLQTLHGFGKKIEQRIQEGIERFVDIERRTKLADAMSIAQSLLAYLKKAPDIGQIEIAGSFRRRQETVGDLDILATARSGKPIINYFVQFNEIAVVISQGTTRSTVRLRSGIQVDLRVVSAPSYGSALQYLTGSKAHSIALRNIAIKKDLKLNEYGVYKNNKRIAGKTEESVYHAMGLSYIEPELREDRGEIAAAAQNKLPNLISLKAIRGDLHCHTNATDGRDTLEAMTKAAAEKGYDYIAVTDHSKHLTVANGLNEKRLLQQIKAIDRLNAKLTDIVILKSIEVDILEDGSLDLSDDVLKELDLTVCSIHSHFNLSPRAQTERIMRAMDNRYFTILGHPTGRLISKREPYEIDLERIMKKAKENNCFLELNAQPERLDFNDIYCKMAKEMGLKLAISSDAHSTQQFNMMQFGVFQARRGWLEANDVINTRKLVDLKKLLKKAST